MHTVLRLVLAIAFTVQLALAAKTTYVKGGETVVASLTVNKDGATKTLILSTLADGSGGDATADDPNTVPPVFTRTPVTVVTATWASGTIQDDSAFNSQMSANHASQVSVYGAATTGVDSGAAANSAARGKTGSSSGVLPVLLAAGGIALGAFLI